MKRTLKNAVARLNELGSDQDPIIFRGEETTAVDLLPLLKVDTPAGSFRISYWVWYEGDKRMKRIKNGTLGGMIRERERAQRMGYRMLSKPDRERTERCPACKRRF